MIIRKRERKRGGINSDSLASLFTFGKILFSRCHV